MIDIETKTNWPLISKANVLLQTSENENYTLSAHRGKMNFCLTGKDTKVIFETASNYKTWRNRILTEEYVAKQETDIILRIKCNKLLGPFGEFVFIKNKWFGIPNFVKPSIKEYSLFCDRKSLSVGSEVKAFCYNSKFKREALVIVSYLWMRKWIRQD
jgi:hypothetical protein